MRANARIVRIREEGGPRFQSYFFFAFLALDFLLFLDDFLLADFLDESLDFLADPEPPFLDFLDF